MSDQCDCADRGCPECGGLCENAATSVVYRVDMDDITGTPMCETCTVDALESGVFRAGPLPQEHTT